MTTALPALHPFDDVAARYGLSLRSLVDAARARKFTHTRIGNQRYFTAEQLQAYLASRTVQAERPVDGLAGVRARRAQQARRRTTASPAA